MCEDQWHGEEEGLALICDGTATLPPASRQTSSARELALMRALVARATMGERAMAQRRGNHTPAFFVSLEDLRRWEPAPLHLERFLWLEGDIPDAKSQTEDESRETKEGPE